MIMHAAKAIATKTAARTRSRSCAAVSASAVRRRVLSAAIPRAAAGTIANQPRLAASPRFANTRPFEIGLPRKPSSSPTPSAPCRTSRTGAATASHSAGRQRRESSRPVGNTSGPTVTSAIIGADAHSPSQPIHGSAGSRSTKCEYVAYDWAATATVTPSEVAHTSQPIGFRGTRATISAPSGSSAAIAASRVTSLKVPACPALGTSFAATNTVSASASSRSAAPEAAIARTRMPARSPASALTRSRPSITAGVAFTAGRRCPPPGP